MPGFDILDRSISIAGSLFIEASAGTGKTFTLVTALVRLIAEEQLTIDEILVVTFTKAATFELKTRLRNGLEEAYELLKKNEGWSSALTDSKRRKALKAAKTALFSLDEANIFTIHSFCHQIAQEFALQAKMSFDVDLERSKKNEWGRIIKDQLRCMHLPSFLLPSQFEIAIKWCDRNFDIFVSKLIQILSSQTPIAPPFSLDEWKQKLALVSLNSEQVKHELEKAAFSFKGFANQKRELKKEAIEAIDAFASFFEPSGFTEEKLNRLLEKGESLLNFAAENKSKKGECAQSGLLSLVQSEILPLLEKAIDPYRILLYMASLIQPKLDTLTQEEELYFFEDYLKINASLSQNAVFADGLRKRYKAVLIDEFQDTDTLQWEIFSNLFAHPEYCGRLIVVGDPKQAIYAFRGADIYTYLKAKKSFREEHIVSLSVNFRSSTSLVGALNGLFGCIPHFFPLPKESYSLPCPPVKPSQWPIEEISCDNRGPAHFFIRKEEDKEEAFFAFITQEIFNLVEKGAATYSEIAILVKDRYEANRFYAYALSCALPVTLRRTESIIESPALDLLIDLLDAILDPKDLPHLLRVLGGPLFCLNEEEIKEIYQSDLIREEYVKRFYTLKGILSQEGILPLFYYLKEIAFHKLAPELYLELLQLVEIGAKKIFFLDGYIPYYESLKKEDPEKEEFKKRQCQTGDSVQIMTIHTSKGLEFNVVFALGLGAPLPKSKSHVSQSEEEEERAEKMRLIYVALTRAKKRVYIPYALASKNTILDLFFEKIGNFSFSPEWLNTLEGVTWSYCPQYVSHKPPQSEIPSPPIKEPEIPLFPRIYLHSFSSLAKKEEVLFDREKEKIPFSGPEAGVFLHLLFEKIDFAQAQKAPSIRDFIPLIEGMVKKHGYDPFLENIAQLTFNAFQAPLQTGEKSFCLKDLCPDKIHREMDFLYFTGDAATGGMKGVVDLFFEYENAFYLLDWKSNYLGKTPEDYNEEAVLQAMHAHDYFTQEKIYREAVKKYLSLYNKSKRFKGSFYVFLRGLPKKGVIYVRDS